jgi:hypothetical protein
LGICFALAFFGFPIPIVLGSAELAVIVTEITIVWIMGVSRWMQSGVVTTRLEGKRTKLFIEPVADLGIISKMMQHIDFLIIFVIILIYC